MSGMTRRVTRPRRDAPLPLRFVNAAQDLRDPCGRDRREQCFVLSGAEVALQRGIHADIRMPPQLREQHVEGEIAELS
jgi:hypothetical protein